jgi:hypothetical protein
MKSGGVSMNDDTVSIGLKITLPVAMVMNADGLEAQAQLDELVITQALNEVYSQLGIERTYEVQNESDGN